MKASVAEGSAIARKSSHYYTLRYTIVGLTLGLLFLAMGTLVAIVERHLPMTLASAAEVQLTEPLLWLVDLIPILLACLGAAVGWREDQRWRMMSLFRDLAGSLEGQLSERTLDLDRVAEFGQRISAFGNLEQILDRAVDLIQSSFYLYSAHVYLADDTGHNLELRAGAVEASGSTASPSHRLPLSFGSTVGAAGVQRQTIVAARNVSDDHFLTELIQNDSWSHIAIPLQRGERLLGVLDLRADKTNLLTTESLPALEAVAIQLAIAIDHALLVANAIEAKTEMEARAGQAARGDWQEFLNAIDRDEFVGYAYRRTGVVRLDEPKPAVTGEGILSMPIVVAGQTVGWIDVQEGGELRPEEEDNLIQAVAQQLGRHIENLRLLAEAERYRNEAESATRRLTREGWDQFLKSDEGLPTGYLYDGNQVGTLDVERDEQGGEIPAYTLDLNVRGEPIGRLEVVQAEDLDQGAAELTSAVVSQLSTHLENLRLAEQTELALAETEEQAVRLAALSELGQALASASTLEDVFRIAAEKTWRVIPADRTSVALLSESGSSFEILALHGETGAAKVGDVVPIEGSALGIALQEDRVVVVNQAPDGGHPGIQSFIVAPLKAGGRTFGTLNAGCHRPKAYDAQDERLLLQVASMLATIMDSRRLFSETEKRAEELAVLNEMGRDLASQVHVETVVETIYRHAAKLVDAKSCSVALYDSELDEVSIRVFGEGEIIDTSALRRIAGRGVSEYVIATRQPLLIEDNVHRRLEELEVEIYGRIPESWLGVPMITGKQVIGVIAVQSFTRPRAYDDHHRDLLTAIASQAAIAIENARLFEQVQARARRERILREVTARVRGLADVDTIMRTAAQEVGQALGRNTFVYLGNGNQNRAVGEGSD